MKNPAAATHGDDETVVLKEKVKSCLGFLMLFSGQRIPKHMTCVGIPFSREEVSPSRFDDGQKLEWVKYDCVGFSTYLKQSVKEPFSDKEITWKQPYCAGLWFLTGEAPRTAVPSLCHAVGAGSYFLSLHARPKKEGAQEVPK